MAGFLITAATFVAQVGASYLLGRLTARDGQKLEDGGARNGDYGMAMPRVYGGAVRLPAVFMAQAKFKETEHKVEDYSEVVGAISGAATGFLIAGPVGAVVGAVGGFLFGSATPDQKYYTYSCSFGLLLADRSGDDPIEAMPKLWGAGRVIFNAAEQSPVSETSSGGKLVKRSYGQNRFFKSMTLYGGGLDQTADPVLAAEIGEQPGYVRTSYIVIEDFQLETFGNALPQDFEALIQAKQGQTLAEVAERFCSVANIDPQREISTSALTGMEVRGYAITRETTCWEALEPLMPVFRIDAAENAGQVRFYTRERGLRSTIAAAALGAYEDGDDPPDRIRYSRKEDMSLPRETSLTFVDPARDYQPNTATSRRSEGDAASNIATNLALTLTADEGATAAATIHWDAWLGRTAVSTTLSDDWDSLTPGVCFAIPTNDTALPYRMTRKLRGANGIIEAEFLSAENVAFSGTVTGASGEMPEEESTLLPDTRVVPMDMPILQDAHDDFGFYVAMAGTASYWERGRVEVSADGVTYGTLADGSSAAVMGDVAAILPAGPTDGLDDTLDTASVLTVELLHSGMALSSATDAELDALANFAFVGTDGQGEYLQFKTATHVTGNTWQLSNLRRGRRGTDWAMSAHVAGEIFVLLGEGGIYRKPVNDDTGWGDELTLRGVTIHQDPAEADLVDFTNTGEGKKPFSVIQLQGSFDGSNDLTLTWEARPRLFSGAIDPTESYEVDVYRNGVFKRTITVAVEEALYTDADQVTDGFTPGDAIFVRVFQVNDDYGRGHKREGAFLVPAYTLHLEDDTTPVHEEDGITPIGLG